MKEKGPKHRIVVIKLGTSSIVDEVTHEPILSILSLIVETCVTLRKAGHNVVLVSSGAIGIGLRRMDVAKKPKELRKKQALAAIGQCRLMSLWDSLFAHLQQPVAQVLLTRNDIADRSRYLNAQNTFSELLHMGVIPIVNENDTLSVAEIKFGDNDTLSAITAAMVQADYLFLMTDVECLYTSNPRVDPNAKPIEVVENINDLEADVSSPGSDLGTGGMGTKIVAARLATSAGVMTIITKSSKPGNIIRTFTYLEDTRPSSRVSSRPQTPSAEQIAQHAPATAPLHTRFLPLLQPIRDRSFWLLYGLAPHGTIYIDEGAHTALKNKAGLFPVGIIAVEGNFSAQEAVKLCVVKRLRPRSTLPVRMSEWRESSNGPFTPVSMDSPSNGATPNMTASTRSLQDFEHGEALPPSITSSDPGTQTPTSSAAQSNVSELIDFSVPPIEVGRALVCYSSIEINRIKGLRSSEIANLLGYADSEYVAFRDNVSLLDHAHRRPATAGKPPATAETEVITNGEPSNSSYGNLGSFA